MNTERNDRQTADDKVVVTRKPNEILLVEMPLKDTRRVVHLLRQVSLQTPQAQCTVSRTGRVSREVYTN